MISYWKIWLYLVKSPPKTSLCHMSHWDGNPQIPQFHFEHSRDSAFRKYRSLTLAPVRFTNPNSNHRNDWKWNPIVFLFLPRLNNSTTVHCTTYVHCTIISFKFIGVLLLHKACSTYHLYSKDLRQQIVCNSYFVTDKSEHYDRKLN